jgi:hypothetical protein
VSPLTSIPGFLVIKSKTRKAESIYYFTRI